MELVEVENLSYWYPARENPSLAGVNLTLTPGEFVLMVGLSGSGKSTLCRALNGLVPHFYGGRMEGRVSVAGKDTTVSQVKELSTRVGMVFQDPENQLVTENPVSEVAFGLENLGVDTLHMHKRVEEVLVTLRLSGLRDKRVSELSGGEKQKVALASVLVMHPDVLVLDEPTSQLDPVSAEDFLATIKALNDELGLAVLLAEHRIERCFHFADRVVVLDKGQVLFSGIPEEMASWSRGKPWVPLPPITRLFLERDGASPPLTVKDGRERLWVLARGAGAAVSDPNPAEMECEEPVLESRPRRRKGGQEEAPLLEVDNLWHVYPDGTEALRGIDTSISSGEFVAVIGENGSGKTTLVKHFNGLLRPGKGRVFLEGRDIKDEEVSRLARTCGMLVQNPNLQLVSDTVEGELEASLKALGVESARWTGLINEALETFELVPFRKENPADLSCGERERVALASVLVTKPRLLVLDEPTRGVDQLTKNRLAAYLRDYHTEGNTVVLVTHDLEFAADGCDRVILMGGGRVLADGDKHRVLSDSLFYTTQFNKSFRGVLSGVITSAEASRALEALS
ncbi:MAG: energy-coupling factor ABC transporter ATP-binding protein [Actinobacteria bacterium]|nr:energy-coupling factor ABC transporter ATP-binding protein [Actinomycetota bacterium]